MRGFAGSLVKYNNWLETVAFGLNISGKPFKVPQLYGFVLGFTKAQPLFSHHDNLLVVAGINYGQEFAFHSIYKVPCFVCSDTFVYHQRATTLSKPHTIGD